MHTPRRLPFLPQGESQAAKKAMLVRITGRPSRCRDISELTGANGLRLKATNSH